MYTTPSRRSKSARRARSAQAGLGIGILAAQLLFALQDELYRQLAEAGFDDLLPRHGIVLAYLDPEGSRATDLAAMSGRRKQIVGRMVDELEALGYVERAPDPADRRAKLVVPTPRGDAVMRLSDKIMTSLARRSARVVGEEPYLQFVNVMKTIIQEFRRPPSS